MYGQQFSSPAASAAKWIFFGFIAIVLMAILLGTNIKDATWFNPKIAAAEANRINIETAHQQATYELQERLANAQTEADIQAIQRDQNLLDAQYTHDIQALTQDLEHREIAFKTWVTFLNFAGSALSLAIVISMILWAGSKALVNVRSIPPREKPTHTFIPPIEKTIHPLPEREPYEPLESPQRRYERRLAERQQEITAQKEFNEMIVRMKAVLDPAQMSKEEYNKHPLAGD
jgi:hypothetical protein